jgi:hypothetical protein
MEAVDRKDFASAVAIGAAFLELCPVDAKFHIYVATALLQQGKSAQAQQHQRWFVGLTDSVLKTGNGKAPETAYVTISIAEEYAVLLRMRLQAESQVLVDHPFPVDSISARGENGQTSTIYFNPSWHFIRLASGADG